MRKLRPSEVNIFYSSRSVWFQRSLLYIMFLLCIQFWLMLGVDNSPNRDQGQGGLFSSPIEIFQARDDNGVTGGHELPLWKASDVTCFLFTVYSLLWSPLFLPSFQLQWATFSLEYFLLILLLLVGISRENFNPPNFYPWEGISCFSLEISGCSWRACVGPPQAKSRNPIWKCMWQKTSLSFEFPGRWECSDGLHFLLGCGVFLFFWPASINGKLSHRIPVWRWISPPSVLWRELVSSIWFHGLWTSQSSSTSLGKSVKETM